MTLTGNCARTHTLKVEALKVETEETEKTRHRPQVETEEAERHGHGGDGGALHCRACGRQDRAQGGACADSWRGIARHWPGGGWTRTLLRPLTARRAAR